MGRMWLDTSLPMAPFAAFELMNGVLKGLRNDCLSDAAICVLTLAHDDLLHSLAIDYLQICTGTGGGAVLTFFDGPGPEESRAALSEPLERFPNDREVEGFESKEFPEGSLRGAFPDDSACTPTSSKSARAGPRSHGCELTSSCEDKWSLRFRALSGYLQTCARAV